MFRMLDFKASPLPGCQIKGHGPNGIAVLICDASDPEAFLREQLGKKALVLDELVSIMSLTQDEVEHLPDSIRPHLFQTGWCMLLQEDLQPS